ncbi:MAG: response regulator transcription factor [Acidimicrobiales bacterium]
MADDDVSGPIRIVVVDDHQMVLDGLVAMLRPHGGDVEVAAATTDVDDARRLVVDLEADVALVDVRMKAASGLELCGDLLRVAPGTKVVLLTVYDDEQYLFEGLRAGASGYLTKQIVAEELVDALRRVLAGDIVVDPVLAGRVALTAARLHRGEFWPGAALGLSQRESEVLGLIVNGHANRAIAEELTLGEETIKTHVSSIYRSSASLTAPKRWPSPCARARSSDRHRLDRPAPRNHLARRDRARTAAAAAWGGTPGGRRHRRRRLLRARSGPRRRRGGPDGGDA